MKTKTSLLIVILLIILSATEKFSQNLSAESLVPNEIYFLERVGPGQICYRVFQHQSGTVGSFTTKNTIHIHHASNAKIEGGYEENESVQPYAGTTSVSYRKATPEEKTWLEESVNAGRFLTKEEALRSASKNRGKVHTDVLSILSADRLSDWFNGKKNGFSIYPIYFNYQFVNCAGEVQMMVKFTTKPLEQGTLVNRGETKTDGYVLNGKFYPLSYDMEMLNIYQLEADLFFGSVGIGNKLGKITLNNIVGNFAGCFGETFKVVEEVGKDSKDKQYTNNLDKFVLGNIRILNGGVRITDKKRAEIERSLLYDEFGNPRDGSRNAAGNNNNKAKYDAFGNPIKSNSTPKTGPKEKKKQKYDEFGNPIDN